jgi:hypothetical protein
MAIELNVNGDFNTILDGFEEVSLKRRGSADTVVVPKAWRYSSQTEEATSGVADVARNDVVWQFAWDDSVAKPTIGDKIIDGSGACWTILSIAELGAKTRLRCLSRNLHLVHGLENRVDIQQAIWEDGGSGPEIVGWLTLRTAVPARIQPDRITVDTEATPLASTATYRVVLGDGLVLDHNHRIVGIDGTVYQVIDFAQAERIDVLPIASVVKILNP